MELLQLQRCISCADLCDTDVNNDCLLYNHGTRSMGKSVNWRTYSTPNRINKIEEKGMCFVIVGSHTRTQTTIDTFHKVFIATSESNPFSARFNGQIPIILMSDTEIVR